jgi:hypothetical protein
MSLNTSAEDTPTSGCQVIDHLIQASLHNECHVLKWFPNEKFSNNIESVQNFTDREFSYATHKRWGELMLIILGNDDKCTPAFVTEFARIFSLPTYAYKNPLNRMEFRRYTTWLQERNKMIRGFTRYNGSYYLIADRHFSSCYYQYGFCSACGILRCSPVWCICGRKELFDTWTSNNKNLDNFIRKSQIQTNSANDAYLEWIPFNCIEFNYWGTRVFNNLPASTYLKLFSLDITNETDEYYNKVTDSITFMNRLCIICFSLIMTYSNIITPTSYAIIIQTFLLLMFGLQLDLHTIQNII